MKRISERLDEIAQERSMYHLTERDPQRRSGVIEWRQTISHISEPQIYGRKDDTKKIVDFLIGDASHFEELCDCPIVGLGGLGKTTLAQVIFHHEKVVNHFELRIWVCVSEDFSWKRMTKAIVKEVSRHSCEDLDPEQLQQRLQDLLQSKRYLLVLDDVWDDDQENWQMMKSLLACGAKGTSVLVTTRLLTVATIMKTTPPHELSELSDNDCWQLFKCRAFRPDETEQEELEVIGKEIAKKCRGVPLAAKALGGLRFKRKKSEWLNIMESNLLEVSHNPNSIMPVLRLSYLNLPIKHRQCFAFCAIFPKDKIINKEYLIHLWMANGFISSNERLDYEDVGDDVWNELYLRSFFQDVDREGFGRVIFFKMHDLVHDLAQFVAEDVCCITNDNVVVTILSERIYHLSYHTHKSDNMNQIQLHPDKPLRTCILPFDHHANVLKCYTLRVLHYRCCEKLSPKIGHMKHLRYLNLSNGDFKTLPDSLCKLWNLQILILDYCLELRKLPNSLICLKAVQKISLIGCDSLTSLPPRLGKLTSLRNLSKFIVGMERGLHLAELGQLKLKGYLEIYHLERVKSVMGAREANMASKQLEGLTLKWESNEEWKIEENVEEILKVLKPDTQQLEYLYVTGYKGVHFPQWMSSCPLKELYIRKCLMFNVSAGFECLEVLIIVDCREVEGMHEALPHMTALKELRLDSLANIESLPDCFGNLPLLRHLYIRDCAKLKCLPPSLSHSNLELLIISHCSEELKKRCEKETGDDWPKIAHIPKIDIW